MSPTHQLGVFARHWKTMLYSVVLTVVAIGIFDARFIKQQMKALRIAEDSYTAEPASLLPHEHLPMADRLLLDGEREATGHAERWRALWQSDPDNPAYLAEYVRGILQDRQPVPEEILAHAERIDPDNSWFLTMQAAASIRDIIERNKHSKGKKEPLDAEVYTVTNEEVFANAIRLFHRAAEKTRYESYSQELTSRRIALMGRPSSYVAFLRQLAFTAGITAHGAMEMMVFSKAISHHATRCAETNDQAELKRTIHTWKSLTHGFIEDSSSMIEGLIAKVVLHGPARNFRDATAKLDMPDLAVHFAEQAQRHQEERDRRKRADSHQSADLIIHHASIMAGLSLPMIDAQVQDPPKMTASDFHPSRLAEHAYYQGIAMRIICLLLLIIAGTLGIRMACLPAEAKALSKTVVMELAPKDWLLLLAIGGLAPALLYFTLQYASPLNTRAWGPKLIGIHQFFAMHAAMLILSLSLSAALISWLHDRKLGLWFPSTRFPKIRWVIVFCALAGLLSFSSLNLLIHQASASVPAKFALLMGFVFCPLPILWLIIRLILPWMGKGNAISRLATSLRMQFPVLAVAFLLCALSVPLLQWEERHWMQQDHLLVATPEKPAMTAHEWDITQILRKELRETLAQIPE